MKKQTITIKILGIVIIGFIITAISVLFLSNFQITASIDASQNEIYKEKINIIFKTLERKVELLNSTENRAVYEEGIQESTIKALKQTFYKSKDQQIYPFIFNDRGVVVMHPNLQPGDRSLQKKLYIKKGLKMGDGDFIFIDGKGEKRWSIFRAFPDWNWLVGYTIPLNIKYRDARRLRNSLTLTMIIIMSIVGITLSIIISRITKPINTLTKATKAIAEGDLSYPIDSERKDELGSLARNFATMRDAVSDKITELTKSEERFRVLIDQAADAAFVHDVSGHILMVNRLACDSLGYTRDELLSMSVQDIDSNTDRIDDLKDVWPKLAPGQPVTLYGQHRRKDGTGFPVEVRIGILDMEGSDTILALARDITDRKKARDEILKEKSFLEGLINNLPGIFFVYTMDNKIIKWNKHYEEISGYSAEELYHMNSLQFFPDYEKDKISAAIQKVFTEGHSETEGDMLTRDGRIIPYYFSAGAVIIENEQFMIGYGTDISEIRKAEGELKLLQKTIEQAAESIAITDSSGKVQYVNPSFEKLSGYSRKEVSNTDLRMLSSGKHDKAFFNKMWQTMKQGKIWSGRITNKKKDGTLYTQESTITPVLNDSGEIINYIAIQRDITEQMKLESQLQQAQKMEAIGTLAGGISHDFNNILHAVLGYTQLAQKKSENEYVIEKIGIARQAAMRATDLIAQIMTFSRKDKNTEEYRILDVIPFIKETIKLLKSTIPATINLKYCFNAENTKIKCNPVQIQQVLMNIGTNAAHAMKNRPGDLEIGIDNSTIESERIGIIPGKYLLINIRDEGTGMDNVTKDRIFEPFFTTKDRGEGTGLGLSVSYGIIKNHGGDINVYSEPGRGTTFHIFLPVSTETAENIFQKDQTLPEGNETIMVVDDEDVLAKLNKERLEELGYTVDKFTSSRKALDTYMKNPDKYDLIYADHTMPEMTGLDMAKKIRNLENSTDKVPIIITSGLSQSITDKEMKEAGIDLKLSKPLEYYVLAQAVRKLLDKKVKP